jgi:3-oxoacyl-[acyl-carrier protein] reductase
VDLGLAGRAYLVTGGSRGLGFATAQVLVDSGARVVVSARGAETVQEAVQRLGGAEVAAGVAADNADPETPDRLVAAARDAFGRLDGALISVGGPPGGPFDAISDEAWRQAFDTVFLGTVRLLRRLGAELPRGGSVAMVLSSTVREPLATLTISNGLRPGLAMLAKQLSNEWAARGVRVNTLLPSRIDTDRLRELDAGADDPAAVRRAQEQRIPLGRYGEPAEFGAAAAFLLSPAAGYLTGVALPVDGGMLHGL